VMPDDLSRARRRVRLLAAALCLILPLVAGGCPDFRNGVVDAVDVATRSLIFNTAEPDQAFLTASESIINSALDLFFDQFRAQNTSSFTSFR
jgi:hypothetical protein